MGYLKEFDKHGRTDMGARPYAGIAPRGMTSKQYSELEYNVGNANEMPDSVFNKRVDKETQKIANKYGNTIYAPQKHINQNQLKLIKEIVHMQVYHQKE